jgi:hypothetical protein
LAIAVPIENTAPVSRSRRCTKRVKASVSATISSEPRP